jgi:hypothetical protein
MDTTLISNLIDVSLCLVALFISVRSFDVYMRVRYRRLFILGLSMLLVSLSAGADFTGHYIKLTTPGTDWFFYMAQASGFFFVLLSLVSSSNTYLKFIMVLSILSVPPLLAILFLSPFLPGIPSTSTLALLEGIRWIICFMIFFAYFAAFTNKATHFNRFMSAAFLLISLGNFMSMLQSFSPTLHPQVLSTLGNITNVFGLLALIIAVSWN